MAKMNQLTISPEEAKMLLHILGKSIVISKGSADRVLHPDDSEGWKQLEEEIHENEILFNKISGSADLDPFSEFEKAWGDILLAVEKNNNTCLQCLRNKLSK